MTKKTDFVIPSNIKVHGNSLVLNDLDLRPGDLGTFEARADYKGEYGDFSFSITFHTEERFNELLALADGEVVPNE